MITAATLAWARSLGEFGPILVFSGANQPVLDALDEAGVVQIEENAGTTALERIAREGISSEHTLYAHTTGARKLGKKGSSEAPAEDLFEFGELEGRGKKASTITIDFSGATTITYDYSDGTWLPVRRKRRRCCVRKSTTRRATRATHCRAAPSTR